MNKYRIMFEKESGRDKYEKGSEDYWNYYYEDYIKWHETKLDKAEELWFKDSRLKEAEKIVELYAYEGSPTAREYLERYK